MKTQKHIRAEQGLYSAREAAEQLGIKANQFCYLRRTEVVEKPKYNVGGRYLAYGTEQIERMREALKPRNRYEPKEGLYYSAFAAAALLHISTDRLRRLASVVPPSCQRGRRYVYTIEDVEKLREHIKTAGTARQTVPEGYYSQVEAAKLLGVIWCTWTIWRKKKVVPGPTRTAGNWPFPVYSTEDVEEMRKTIALHKVPEGTTTTSSEVAERWGIEARKLSALCRRLKIGTTKGRRRYLSEADVDKLASAVFRPGMR